MSGGVRISTEETFQNGEPRSRFVWRVCVGVVRSVLNPIDWPVDRRRAVVWSDGPKNPGMWGYCSLPTNVAYIMILYYDNMML